MGYYTRLFIKPKKTPLVEGWTGSLVLNRSGKVLTSTLSSSLPADQRQLVIDTMLSLVQEARIMSGQLDELLVTYDKLKLKVSFSKNSIHLFFTPAQEPWVMLPLEDEPDLAG